MSYFCRRCMDTMDPRFKGTHDAICSILTSIYQRDLDSWLRTWMPQ